MSGWAFAFPPRVEAVDDKSGEIRFRISLNESGLVDSLHILSSTVSSKQEKLCYQALANAKFVKTLPEAKRGSGFYTFRFIYR
jgi:hypothetical protein